MPTPKKLAIVSSHPIQYNAPWFQLLARGGGVVPRVFYTWEQAAAGAKYDPDFGRDIAWDVPLLEGYDHTFVKNTAPDPGTHHFRGLINPTLNREIAEWQPDAVLVFGWNFDSHLRCLRYFHKKLPVFFRGDSTLLDEQPGLRRWLRRIFLRWVYSHVDNALYVGTSNKAYFLKHGLREEELTFAPHAVDNRRFAEPEEEYTRKAAAWRRELGIGESDLVVLFAGKLEAKKNPSMLLQLAAALPDQSLKFVIVGDGALGSGLRQAASADPRIIFLDFQNQTQMPAVYRLADIFILPSVGPGETWGLAVNEAMASGRAIIMSNRAGGSVDLVKEGINGIVFSPAASSGVDPSSWSAAPEKVVAFIRRLLSDRDALAVMQTDSRQRIRAFSYEHIVAAVISITCHSKK